MNIRAALVLAGALLAAAVYLTAARYGLSSDGIGRGAGAAFAAVTLCGLVAMAVAKGSFTRARWDLALPIAGAVALCTALNP
jgi:hypothetical protein